ncbi:MAG TPA: ABC transporter ATP-binding protein [Chthoniobacterales bacterium]
MSAILAGTEQPVVEVQNLRVRFGHTGPLVVKGISVALNRGECLALIGESGSGKSVTLRTLIGLTGYGSKVEADRLRFDGNDLNRFTENKWREIRGARIGFVLQDALGSLDPLRTVGREIDEPLRLHLSLTKNQRATRIIELLESVGVPEPAVRARQYPHQLSGGLRQRALLASAIACAPELVILDEPTTALDTIVQAQVLHLLESLRNGKTSMLIVSHDFGVVARLADRVAVMQEGLIVEQGAAETVFQDPQHPYTRSLLAAASSVHRLGIEASSGTSIFAFETPPSQRTRAGQSSVKLGSDRKTTPFTNRDGNYLIEANNLTKSFTGVDAKKRTVVSDVSFSLSQGSTLGIAGESGSGKTTLARMVLGLERPDSGLLKVEGRAWDSLSANGRRQERRRIQPVFQDPLSSFDPRFTVEKVLGEALGVSGYPSGVRRRNRAIELLELVRLDRTFLGRRPIELSGGQRQRIAIARALAPEPEVIVCDEPISSLDVSVQAQILDLLSDLKTRFRVAGIFISHDLGVIRRMSDQVLIMKDGLVVESGDVGAVFECPQHEYTRRLLDAVPRIEKRSDFVYA